MNSVSLSRVIVLRSYSVLSSKDGVAFLLSVELDGRMLILGGPTDERRVTFMSYSVGFLLSVEF